MDTNASLSTGVLSQFTLGIHLNCCPVYLFARAAVTTKSIGIPESLWKMAEIEMVMLE